MLTLFHCPNSRSSSFLWLLEELGAPYDIKIVTIRHGDGTGAADPANPHPHGKVPAIVHNGLPMFEQTAIALYLTDSFPQNEIGPLHGDPRRPMYLTWLAYYSGVMEPAFTSKFLKVEVPRGSAGWVDVSEAMAFVNRTLEANDYLLGDKFSAADILYAGTFHLFSKSPYLEMTPRLQAYIDRCVARPAFARGAARDKG